MAEKPTPAEAPKRLDAPPAGPPGGRGRGDGRGGGDRLLRLAARGRSRSRPRWTGPGPGRWPPCPAPPRTRAAASRSARGRGRARRWPPEPPCAPAPRCAPTRAPGSTSRSPTAPISRSIAPARSSSPAGRAARPASRAGRWSPTSPTWRARPRASGSPAARPRCSAPASSITAGDDRASIEVARGTVRVKNDAGSTVDVRAGEEATLSGAAEPVVSKLATLADDDGRGRQQAREEVDSPLLRGLGEPGARKRGKTKEKDRAVRLARHAVGESAGRRRGRPHRGRRDLHQRHRRGAGGHLPLPAPARSADREALAGGRRQARRRRLRRPRQGRRHLAGRDPERRPQGAEAPGRDHLGARPLARSRAPRVAARRALRAEDLPDPAARLPARRDRLPLHPDRRSVCGHPALHLPARPTDPSGSTRIGSFDLDLQVLGLDPRRWSLSTRGYDLAGRDGGDRRTSCTPTTSCRAAISRSSTRSPIATRT